MSRDPRRSTDRPARLDGAPLDFAPNNEQGVVFLFSHLARKRFGLRVEKVQAGFPDCVAYRDNKRVRIEFEYRSRNFATHKHDARKCDWIVCWKHDWPAAPPHLRVVELQREFGLGFNVWIQPVRRNYAEKIAKVRKRTSAWSVGHSAGMGDLVLFYRSKPDMFIADVFEITSDVRRVKAGWKKGDDTMASLKRVATLTTPLHLIELQRHRIVGKAGFIRAQMQGRHRVSTFWPELRQMIVERNPSLSRSLREYGAERVD